MLKRITNWFQTPIFPENDENMRSAFLLNTFLNTFSIAFLVLIAGIYLGEAVPSREIVSKILWGSWLFVIALKWVMRSGWVTQAGILFVALIYAATTLAIYNAGSIRAPAISFYILVIVMTGLIINRRAILIASSVCTITFVWLYYQEINGLLPKPVTTVSITQAVTFTTVIVIITIILFLAVKSIDNAMAHAKQELTAREHIDFELHQINARLELIHEIDRDLLALSNTAEIAQKALRHIRQLIPSPRASVTLFDHEEKEARFLTADFDEFVEIPNTPISFEVFGQRVIDKLLENKPWFSDDVLQDPKRTNFDVQLADEQGIRVWLCLPLTTQGKLLGALNLGRKAGNPFTLDDARVGHDIANQIAIAIQQMNLFNALQSELAVRKELIRELEERNDELMRFTYTVSHDLRNPLVTIKGFVGMLNKDLRENRVDRIQNDFQRIANAADKMDDLLSDLLELSRIGRIANPPVEIDPVRLIQDAIDSVDARIRSKNVIVKVTPEIPSFYGDRIRLREVYENLIDNAIKYMGDQKKPFIEVGARNGSDNSVYFVRDNGIGIDPIFKDKIFGLFEKLDPTIEGTGIGLALVKRIIETHGGRVWVESEGLGKGSTFCFTIPNNNSLQELSNA